MRKPEPESAPGRCLDDLLRECEPLILKTVARRMTRWPADVQDDVAQAARVHVWRYALRKFDPARGPFDAFVRLCVDRVIQREVERLDRRTPHEPLPDDVDLTADNSGPDIESVAERIISQPDVGLTTKQAALLRLVLAGGQPRDIGPQLGISPASVSQSLSRLRKKLVNDFVEVAA